MKHVDTIIIGAGLSGLMAAQVLASEEGAGGGRQGLAPNAGEAESRPRPASGKRSLLLDKGKTPGGRLATRRVGAGTLDHGAQFLTARSETFRAWLTRWEEAGWIQPWFGMAEGHARYAAAGGMSRLAKRLAEPHQVEALCEVSRIAPADSGTGYLVEGLDKRTGQPCAWTARAVALTCPLPQALRLLEAGGVPLAAEHRDALAAVRYKPTLALLLTLREGLEPTESAASAGPESPMRAGQSAERPTGDGASGGFWEQLRTEGVLRRPLPGYVAWMADNRVKGVSQASAWTVHLDPDWSEAHYARSDEDVVRLALPFVEQVVGRPLEALLAEPVQVKRWRYAQAHGLLDAPFLDVGGVAGPLVLAGDAFAGDDPADASRVEHAVLSGLRAGHYLAHFIDRR